MPHYYSLITQKRWLPEDHGVKKVTHSVRLKQNIVKGVTDIISTSAKAWLDDYLIRTAASVATKHWMGEQVDPNLGNADPLCIEAIDRAKAVLTLPAERGTWLHGVVENAINGHTQSLEEVGLDGMKAATETLAWLKEAYPPKRHAWQTERAAVRGEYGPLYGWGGSQDIVVRRRGTGELVAILDMKFPLKPRNAKITECAQLAAYLEMEPVPFVDLIGRVQLCNLIYGLDGALLHDRTKYYHPAEVWAGHKMFHSCLALSVAMDEVSASMARNCSWKKDINTEESE